MRLWRLDAQHTGDGAFTRLFQAGAEAIGQRDLLRRGGWLVDVYEVAVGPCSEAEAAALCAATWPVVPEAEIMGLFFSDVLATRMARTARPAKSIDEAKQRLDTIVRSRTTPKR